MAGCGQTRFEYSQRTACGAHWGPIDRTSSLRTERRSCVLAGLLCLAAGAAAAPRPSRMCRCRARDRILRSPRHRSMPARLPRGWSVRAASLTPLSLTRIGAAVARCQRCPIRLRFRRRQTISRRCDRLSTSPATAKPRMPPRSSGPDRRSARPQARRMGDPAQRRNNEPTSTRFRAFIAANPSWPSLVCSASAPRQCCGRSAPTSPPFTRILGRPAGIRQGTLSRSAARCSPRATKPAPRPSIRDAWRTEPLSRELEEQVLQTFGGLVTRADDKARMERRLYANDNDTGDARRATARRRSSPRSPRRASRSNEKSTNAKALLDALPSSAQARSAGDVQPHPAVAARATRSRKPPS